MRFGKEERRARDGDVKNIEPLEELATTQRVTVERDAAGRITRVIGRS
jgi:hypothetical protein